jgi:uncharacterized protein YodC (DUF2158 family)
MKTKNAKKIEQEIKPGDIVILKSGGPQMTVEHVSESSDSLDRIRAHCMWSTSTQVFRHEFPVVCLRNLQKLIDDGFVEVED